MGWSPAATKHKAEEKKCYLEQNQRKVEEPLGASTSWQDSLSEWPSHSYVAMTWFTSNSGEWKPMTLKDICTWREDHLSSFKPTANVCWKNSIHHSHDLFVCDISSNGYPSFRTIHPSTNIFLTLEQMFKQQ